MISVSSHHTLHIHCQTDVAIRMIRHFHESYFWRDFEIMPNCAAVAWASASSSTSSCSLGRGYSEAANAQCFSVLLLLKQKQEGAKKGLTADLCVSVSKSGHPSLYSPSFGRFFCTLFLMIESKEQANRSSICLIENYTKQIAVYIYIEVYVHEKENMAQKKRNSMIIGQ